VVGGQERKKYFQSACAADICNLTLELLYVIMLRQLANYNKQVRVQQKLWASLRFRLEPFENTAYR